MNILCVSSQYLHALRKESKGFRFKLQGYGTFAKACSGIVRTNITDIYGFVMLMDSLPEDTEELCRFLRRADLISKDANPSRRLVIGINNDDGLVSLLRSCDIKNLEVYSANFELVTDNFIKQELYGTVLDGALTPYKGRKYLSSPVSRSTLPLLKAESPFPPDMLLALSPVNKSNTLVDTYKRDKPLATLTSSGSFYTAVRRYVIQRHFSNSEEDRSSIEDHLSTVLGTREKLRLDLMIKFIDRIGGVQ